MGDADGGLLVMVLGGEIRVLIKDYGKASPAQWSTVVDKGFMQESDGEEQKVGSCEEQWCRNLKLQTLPSPCNGDMQFLPPMYDQGFHLGRV